LKYQKSKLTDEGAGAGAGAGAEAGAGAGARAGVGGIKKLLNSGGRAGGGILISN
jgi:hypothetical protein